MVYQPWTREQDLAVLYAKLEYGRKFRNHPDVKRLAAVMGRTEAAVIMRIGNFDSLDPSTATAGLSNAESLTREIWAEYQRSPEHILVEARTAYTELLNAA